MREIVKNNNGIRKAGFVDPRLINYITQCRRMGIADEEIRKKLLKVGWSDEDAERVLGKARRETNIAFLSPDAKTISVENILAKKTYKEFPGKEKKKIFFSKKGTFIISASILVLSAVVFNGYYFLLRKNEKGLPVFSAAESQQKTVETECNFDGLPKPDSSGSAVLRVDSTMKMLMKAIAGEDYCLALSLYTDDSRNKYRDLIKNLIEDENRRNKFLIDLAGYMIPAIDEEDPTSEAKATITSNDISGNSAFNIKFSKKETGEYLISSM